MLAYGSGTATGLLPDLAGGGIVSNGTLTLNGSTASRDIGDSFGNGGGIS